MEHPKQQPKPEWFEQIAHPSPSNHDQLNFYMKTGISGIERIVNFGCLCVEDDFWEDNPIFTGGVEPFNLLWTFDASEIAVVEKEAQYIQAFERKLAFWQKTNPQSLWGRSVRTLVADMTLPSIPDLQNDYYDLAYCHNVLYYMKVDEPDYEKVTAAIATATRAVRPGGYVLAIEPKMGIGEEKCNLPLALNGHLVISECFEKLGLQQETLPYPYDVDYIYLYKKLSN